MAAPTALSWFRRRIPEVPESVVQRLFKFRQIRVFDGQRIRRVHPGTTLGLGDIILYPGGDLLEFVQGLAKRQGVPALATEAGTGLALGQAGGKQSPTAALHRGSGAGVSQGLGRLESPSDHPAADEDWGGVDPMEAAAGERGEGMGREGMGREGRQVGKIEGCGGSDANGIDVNASIGNACDASGSELNAFFSQISSPRAKGQARARGSAREGEVGGEVGGEVEGEERGKQGLDKGGLGEVPPRSSPPSSASPSRQRMASAETQKRLDQRQRVLAAATQDEQVQIGGDGDDSFEGAIQDRHGNPPGKTEAMATAPPVPTTSPIPKQEEFRLDMDPTRVRKWILGMTGDLIFLNKPAGVSTQGSANSIASVIGKVLKMDPDEDEPKIVHRLDRHVSGVLAIARNADTANWLAACFRERSDRAVASIKDTLAVQEHEARVLEAKRAADAANATAAAAVRAAAITARPGQDPSAEATATVASTSRAAKAATAEYYRLSQMAPPSPSSSLSSSAAAASLMMTAIARLEVRGVRGDLSAKRVYWAFVAGNLQHRLEGKIRYPIEMDGRLWPAVTDFKVKASAEGISWVELKAETGRRHQLRIHCAKFLNAPIIGDVRYGYNGLTPTQKLFNGLPREWWRLFVSSVVAAEDDVQEDEEGGLIFPELKGKLRKQLSEARGAKGSNAGRLELSGEEIDEMEEMVKARLQSRGEGGRKEGTSSTREGWDISSSSSPLAASKIESFSSGFTDENLRGKGAKNVEADLLYLEKELEALEEDGGAEEDNSLSRNDSEVLNEIEAHLARYDAQARARDRAERMERLKRLKSGLIPRMPLLLHARKIIVERPGKSGISATAPLPIYMRQLIEAAGFPKPTTD
eukprot:CAMPEP_0175038978 /NCGR_PEP_ID=MMETSP0052_2-20121109/239_1 /TAXON_ID=51329 ORGANISM="Polytomella parva, Strain SAG 63-3" /NCGR_SAMPLE_ID=MMETSP0052_2 /ASSEMBLY_ACC=CAM_ASM_000194 /LENGTH=868 /DNA_ID=CAMNT_0016300601 /DNA_START=219 /DNA_END=2829 /DNA_ORIENTATION=-